MKNMKSMKGVGCYVFGYKKQTIQTAYISPNFMTFLPSWLNRSNFFYHEELEGHEGLIFGYKN